MSSPPVPGPVIRFLAKCSCLRCTGENGGYDLQLPWRILDIINIILNPLIEFIKTSIKNMNVVFRKFMNASIENIKNLRASIFFF